MIKRSHPELVANMGRHYSQPKGFVGRNICYEVSCGSTVYGHIVGGSATLHLVGRDEFFGVAPETKRESLLGIVNNIFYHIEQGAGYPKRNFTTRVLRAFREQVAVDWRAKYGQDVTGFETLVELPRTGELYRRDGWVEVGVTKGQTCKRVAGKGTDSWTGKRVWDTVNLRPKRVFCRSAQSPSALTAGTCIPTTTLGTIPSPVDTPSPISVPVLSVLARVQPSYGKQTSTVNVPDFLADL